MQNSNNSNIFAQISEEGDVELKNVQIHIETLGCRLNQIESESIAKSFYDRNFFVSMDSLSAKTEESFEVLISVLNTCTVTQKSEQKARRLIRMMLEKFPCAVVIVTGCYAQVASEQIKKMDERVFVLGGQIKSRMCEIPSLLETFLKKKRTDNENKNEKLDSVSSSYPENSFVFNPLDFKNQLEKIAQPPQKKIMVPENSFKLATSSFFAHSRASLKIQDGCNNSCSYCAIHIARGHSVSIDVQTAIDRVVELENKGFEEVVITTVNIAQYRGFYAEKGKAEGVNFNFTKLLQILLEKTQKIHFRISSLYPEVVDDDFCSVIKNPRVQPYFHISVQSGSDKILKLMNRTYEADDVVRACKKIRSVKENPFIACDIIAGFPGESNEDFERTMQLCYDCDFSWVHAFPYSERPGTAAINFKNKVPQSVAGERSKKLTEWAVNQKIEYCQKFVGKNLDAILETVKRPSAVVTSQGAYVYHAVTENFLHCQIFSNCELSDSKKVHVQVEQVLSEKIKKGGDLEVLAKII